MNQTTSITNNGTNTSIGTRAYSAANNLKASISNTASDAASAASKAASNAASNVASAASAASKVVSSAASNVASSASKVASSASNAASKIASSASNAKTNATPNSTTNATNKSIDTRAYYRAANNLKASISNTASDASKAASKAASSAASNAASGLSSAASTAANKASIGIDEASKSIKQLTVFYPLVGLIAFLLVILLLVLLKIEIPFTKQTQQKSNEELNADIFFVLFFVLFIIGICITLLPSLKDIRKLFEQISNVTYIIIFTIFLILFLTLTSSDTIDKNASIIVPFTIILGIILFYKSYVANYIEDFNVNYERIKNMILIFCLIVIFIVYYNIDPGGYIKKNFGYTLLLTIITTVFAFLYLMIVLTLTGKDGETPIQTTSRNFLEIFSKISSYGSLGFLGFIVIISIILGTYAGGFVSGNMVIAFIILSILLLSFSWLFGIIGFFLFLIITTILIVTYQGGFFANKSKAGFVMIIVLLICILWSVLLGFNLFPEISNKSFEINDKMSLYKRSLLALFGITISGLIIYWIVYNIQNLSGKSGVTSFVLNIILVAIILGLIYKTIYVRLPAGDEKKNNFFALILSIIFYIPCIFSGLFDSIGEKAVGEYHSTTMGSVIMLVVALALISLYYFTPSVFTKINLQGGEQLVNKPVYTDKLYSLGTYEELNGSDNFDYKYAISCWIYLDSVPPNTNDSYMKYTSLLNFGDKPNILYKGSTNTLMITMEQKDLDKVKTDKLTDFDDEGNRIIYKNTMLLQKWNNIIINYNGGVLDVFLNGELVKSSIGVVPYYTLDNLTIGQDGGIKGGICNVIYFKRALTSYNIYYLYNMVKNRTPPLLNDSNETVTKANVNTTVSSYETVI